ncbi:MAG TPA: hypothetical protein PLX02_00440 [Syntrophorhabdaceae bacterium]|nr:hypothetical protein [Syntrophorhabdaceae bacterium]HQM80066.1 hypothetical protein [Syntrophorhabdaceae bacterium]
MKREEELIKAGWERRFVACEPRLSEMVGMYREIGFEVRVEPLPTKEERDAEGSSGCEESGCTACLDVDPDRYKIIFTRPAT